LRVQERARRQCGDADLLRVGASHGEQHAAEYQTDFPDHETPPPRALRVYLMMATDPRMKLPKDRIPYSAIVDRPPLKLPNDGRIAVWTILNVEEWSIERNMPRTVLPPPYGQPL